jgi:hypothetical protein
LDFDFNFLIGFGNGAGAARADATAGVSEARFAAEGDANRAAAASTGGRFFFRFGFSVVVPSVFDVDSGVAGASVRCCRRPLTDEGVDIR